jgi:hypothetical protein
MGLPLIIPEIDLIGSDFALGKMWLNTVHIFQFRYFSPPKI